MVDQLAEKLEASVLDDTNGRKAASADPLVCPGCQKRFENPKIFPRCYHSVCEKCASRRDPDTSEAECSRCYSTCSAEEILDDRILQFLLKVADGAASHCDNCEGDAMLFCTTCNQPLCERCRSLTHATKMFASHTIVPHEQHSRGAQNMICPTHQREYVMYSMDTNHLLCLACFSEIDGSGKSQSVDLDCAYSTVSQHLQSSVQKLESLLGNVTESIEKIECLPEETEQNADATEGTVVKVHEKLTEALEEKRRSLLETVDKQRADKLRLLESQLRELKVFNEVVKGALETGNVFSGSTTVYQFLDLVSDLMERMEFIFDRPQQLSALTSSQISCSFRNQIRKCVDEALGPNMHSVTGSNFEMDPEQFSGQSHWFKASTSPHSDVTNGVHTQPGTSSTISYLWRQRNHTVSPDPASLEQLQRHQSMSFATEIGRQYAEHFQSLVMRNKAFQMKLDVLKKHVQELHRDMTVRRCQPKAQQVSNILVDSSKLQFELEEHRKIVEDSRSEFEGVWRTMLEDVEGSQRHYNSVVAGGERMEHDMTRLQAILRSIEPYIASLSMATEQLHPALGQKSLERAQQEVMSNIFDKISSTTVNTQQRVKAIQTTEDQRTSRSVDRKRSNSLEENLIRTKESLRSLSQVVRNTWESNSIGTMLSASPTRGSPTKDFPRSTVPLLTATSQDVDEEEEEEGKLEES